MPASEREHDVLDDMRETLRRLGVTEGIIQRTERALRNTWQGPCYVRRSSLDTEDEIKRRLAAGEHPAAIAKATGLHRTTIVRRRSRWL